MNKTRIPKDSDLLVSVNGTFGTAFRKGVGGKTSDVVVFTPKVDGHKYEINNQDFRGKFKLHGAPCSPNRGVLDYDLDGRVFSVDTLKYPVDTAIIPQGWMEMPYPAVNVPHRPHNIAFRDGSAAGPHASSVPGAVLLQFHFDKDSEVWVSGPRGAIQPKHLRDKIYIYWLVVSGLEDKDPSLIHTREAWRQFSAHCSGLSCELFLATECDRDNKLPDRFGITDYEIDDHVPTTASISDEGVRGDTKFKAKATNCKTPNTFLLNGTTDSVNWG